VLGAVVGTLLEGGVNGVVGYEVIRNGQIWGAALALFLVSLPNFARMGQLTVKSDKPAVNLAAGLALFVVISVFLSVVFFAILALIARLFAR
jgi:hypothetical protein